ncbi:MAG: hypothetical protein ACE5J0_01685, partial [Candidatus Paceibacterales bacterium]
TLKKPSKKISQKLSLLEEQEEKSNIDKCLREIDLGGKNLIPLKNEVVKDYNCQTILELMLAGRISTLYWRITKWESVFNYLLGDSNDIWSFCYSFDDAKRDAVETLSKGVESAHRQWISSIALLKELKRPSLNLQIKTKGTFIAQNQQINVRKRNKQPNKKKKLLMSNNLGK